LVARGVEDAHVGDDQARQEAAPVGLDRAHGDLEAGAFRHRGDDLLAIFLDARQHPVAQREKAEREREEQDPGEDLDYVKPAREEAPDGRERRADARKPARPGIGYWHLGFRLHPASRCLYIRADLPERITFEAPLRGRFYK